MLPRRLGLPNGVRSDWTSCFFLLFGAVGRYKLIFIRNRALILRRCTSFSFRKIVDSHIEAVFGRDDSLFRSLPPLEMVKTSLQHFFLDFVAAHQIPLLITINDSFWTFLRDIWGFDFSSRLTDGKAENVLTWIHESERRVFFVVQKLYFESFSFEIDDPAYFLFFF